MQDELFEWHFTIAGPPDTAFEGGRFHGRIVMPPDYPMKPPDVYLSTPNGARHRLPHTLHNSRSHSGLCGTGRFETNTKICLSYTSFHPEEWQPAWGVRTMLDALTGIFPVRHVAVIPQERHQTAICTHPELLDIPGASRSRVSTLTILLAFIALQLDQPGVGALTYSDEERKVLSTSTPASSCLSHVEPYCR